MAVYEGARPRTIGIPRRPRVAIETPALPRRRVRAAVRARRAPNRVGMVLGVIVVGFLCAFFSLTQDMRVAELGYQIDQLGVTREQLDARSVDLRSELNRLAKAPAIRKQAIDHGLGPLAEPLVLPAR